MNPYPNNALSQSAGQAAAPQSTIEAISSRIAENNNRLGSLLDLATMISSRIAGESATGPEKGNAPRAVRSGIAGEMNDRLDEMSALLNLLEARISNLRDHI